MAGAVARGNYWRSEMLEIRETLWEIDGADGIGVWGFTHVSKDLFTCFRSSAKGSPSAPKKV
jgi:hypothetical protein